MKQVSVILLLVTAACGTTPKYTLTDADRARLTMHDMRSIAIAVESYRLDHKALPKVTSIDELATHVTPMYIRKLPQHDAWGTTFQFNVDPEGKGFRIISAGSDRRFAPVTWADMGDLTSFSEDAVIEGSKSFPRMWLF